MYVQKYVCINTYEYIYIHFCKIYYSLVGKLSELSTALNLKGKGLLSDGDSVLTSIRVTLSVH